MAETQAEFEIIGQEVDESATDDLLSGEEIPETPEAAADLMDDAAAPVMGEGLGGLEPAAAPAAVEEEVSAPVDPYAELAVPESIRIWKESFEKALAEKDAAAQKEIDTLKQQAATELKEWYQRNESEKREREQANRSAEDEFIAKRDETTPGNEWERVAFLLDFNQKTVKNARDVSRMRSILIQLKTSPLVR